MQQKPLSRTSAKLLLVKHLLQHLPPWQMPTQPQSSRAADRCDAKTSHHGLLASETNDGIPGAAAKTLQGAPSTPSRETIACAQQDLQLEPQPEDHGQNVYSVLLLWLRLMELLPSKYFCCLA